MKLTIGNLAKQAEVTIETIHYYQRIGLLDEPEVIDVIHLIASQEYGLLSARNNPVLP